MNKNPSHGFSLIELMVVMAIASIMILGISQVSFYQNRVSRAAEINRQVNEIKSQIQTWLQDATVCTNTLSGKVPGGAGGTSIDGIKSNVTNADTGGVNSGDYLMSVGKRFMSTNWMVSSMSLLNSAQAVQSGVLQNAVVNSSGVGQGVLSVTIGLLNGTSGNTLTGTGQDGGAYTTLSKTFYVTFNAMFALSQMLVPVQSNTTSQLNSAGVLYNTIVTNKNPAGVCGANAPIPNIDGSSGGQTYGSVIQAQNQAYNGSNPQIPALGSANNPVFYVLDFDQTQVSNSSPYIYAAYCYSANYNMPVTSCVNSFGYPLGNLYQPTGNTSQ